MDSICANLQAVKLRIANAAQACGRCGDIALVAVSKTFSADAIAAAHACGQHAFGENYAQEAIEKIAALSDRGLEWHFIGPIQSNKARTIAEHFSWVHGIDRLDIARRLSAARPAGAAPLQVCVQVRIGGERTKSGIAPADALTLARAVAALPRLTLRGLMAIPPAGGDSMQQRRYFAQLRELKNELVAAGIALDTLSMGMSADLEAAIAEGATLVRVGTAIFGERQRKVLATESAAPQRNT
jgi:pyridoxal phosphate enzyme (YggS family)